MALVHRATLEPSKQELVEAWLPPRPWSGGARIAEKAAEYRFDDPAGEVGVETTLWRTGDGALLQIPLTYRGEPLEDAEEFLIGTSDHSVLGQRWVYDGCGDPVWAATLATTILTGGSQAQMVIEHDGQLVDVPARMQVRGSGAPRTDVPAIRTVESVRDDGPVTTVSAGSLTLSLVRIVGTRVEGAATLTGAIGDQDLGVLAALR
jgi:Maltokinase N-terminal cap domain